ncbi:MAG: SH3 domain-containing protein [Candidatus Helarchaeota archaeon]
MGKIEKNKKKLSPYSSYEKFLENQARYHKLIKQSSVINHILENQKKWQKILNNSSFYENLLKNQNNYQKLISQSSVLNQIIENQKKWQKILKPSLYASQILEQNINRMNNLSKYINDFLLAKEKIQNEIISFNNNINIDNNGQIIIDNKKVDKFELNSIIKEFFSIINIDQAILYLKKLNPAIRKFLLFLFIHIFIPFFINIYSNSNLMLEISNISKRLSKLELKRYVKALSKLPNYSGNAVVKAEYLNVRSSPTMKSKKIFLLSRGQLVKVLNKRRNWSKIEVAFNGSQIIGWVNSRYLIFIKNQK